MVAFLGSTAFAQINVYFEIRNEQVVGNNYEFDVYMYGDANGTYHSRGHVYIVYNPAAFGSNVVLNGNCSYSHRALLNGQASFMGVPLGVKYSTINFVDNGNRVVITWFTNFITVPPSNLAHNEITTTPQQLYHVSMAIQNPLANPNIQLDLGLMNRQIFYMHPNITGGELQYGFGQLSLPTEVKNFTAEELPGRQARISWTAVEDDSVSHYILEKHLGNGLFEEITKFYAIGEVDEEEMYTYTDDSFMGEENYYRIKLVNHSGAIFYSGVIVMRLDFNLDELIVSYPNPVRDLLFLRSRAVLTEDIMVEITDTKGNFKQSLLFSAGLYNSQLDLSSFPGGVYYVKITSESGQQAVKQIVKL